MGSDWNSSKEIGEKWQRKFMKTFPLKAKLTLQTAHHSFDFFAENEKGNICTIELKSEDKYALEPAGAVPNKIRYTGNICIERWSNYEKRTLGGPWKARAVGATFYVQYFPHENIALLWKTDDLLDYLDSLKLTDRDFKGYVTTTGTDGIEYETKVYALRSKGFREFYWKEKRFCREIKMKSD